MHFDIKILGLVWKSARDIIQEKAGPIKELSVNGDSRVEAESFES